MNRKERRRQEKELKKTPVRENSVHLLGDALSLYRMGQLKPALAKCRDVLAAEPNHLGGLNLSGSIYLELGDTENSVSSLRSALSVDSDNPQAHFNLGTALAANGDLEEAIGYQNHALELKPDYPEALYNLANAFRQTGEPEAAILNYRRALDLAPDYPGAATNLASTLLERSRPEEALQASEAALEYFPGDRDALAFKAIAASETGDADTAAWILAMNDIIRGKDFEAPAGFANLAEFNEVLVAHVLEHPTLTREPHNMATRHGQQTENLSLEPKGPIALLEEMIAEAFEEYMSAIREVEGHPYPPLIPELRKIDIWGTVLDRMGHQAAHMHRNAWVSGCYYAQLPDVMHGNNESKSGWIEFGRPPDEFPCSVEHPVQAFEPREGRMFMFPSFEFHRTIPFESSEQRISIAFDLLP
jgi:tetratricopeptide (TPR) repeat protein